MWAWIAVGALAQERYYLANDDHTDYFWTATGDEYAVLFQTMLDDYLALGTATAINPPEARSRFVADGSLWMWEYEHHRSPAEFETLIEAVREGTITFPMQSLVLLPGAMPTEAVLRDMYYAGRLERRYGLDLDLVIAMENQTLPGGVASLWAGAGAKYSWRGVCGCATQLTDLSERPREIYWFEGPDGQRVLMKWNSLRDAAFGNQSIGGYAEAADPFHTFDYLSTDADFRAVWPFEVYGAFGYGWDAPETYTESFVELALAHVGDPEHQVIVSNELDFFQDFEATHGASLETFRGGFGNEWDLYTASLAAVTSQMRNEVEKLRTAEAMATVAELFEPGFMAGREPARDRAFMQMGLFYDHDWTADGPVGSDLREQFQRDALATVQNYVDTLYDDARTQLGGLIPAGGAVRYAVFNPNTWIRGSATVDLEDTPPDPVHVVDADTRVELPSQRMNDGRLRVLVSGVESVGYKVVEVVDGFGTETFGDAASVTLNTLDNGILQATVARDGSVTSLVSLLDAGRESVQPDGALGQLSSALGTIIVEEQGPVTTIVRVDVPAVPPYTSKISLSAGSDRVLIEHHVSDGFGDELAATFAANIGEGFGIIRHEEVGQIARVARLADGGDYADENTRTDWLTLGHFVDLSDGDSGITISSVDGPFFQAGNSTIADIDTQFATVKVVVGMQVDGGSLGFVGQGGDTSFEARYAVWPHDAFNAAASMRMALEHQDPLVAIRVIGPPDAPLPSHSFSLIRTSDSDVVGWVVKPHEDGLVAGGVVTRWWNLAEEPRTPSITLPYGVIGAAVPTSHIETDLVGQTVPLVAGGLNPTLEAEQLATYRFIPLFQDPLPTVPTNPTESTPTETPPIGDGGPDLPVDDPAPRNGCGCGSVGPPGGFAVAALLLAFRRRQRCLKP